MVTFAAEGEAEIAAHDSPPQWVAAVAAEFGARGSWSIGCRFDSYTAHQ